MGDKMKFIITGDFHGKFDNIENLINIYNPTEYSIIALGDLGCNFYLNKSDIKTKNRLSSYGYNVYAVRGNHEERPENLNIPLVYDEEVQGYCYVEEAFPLIHYLKDGECYNFGGYTALIIGGAFSVDKDYRLQWFKQSDGWSGWFKDEQLTPEEMKKIEDTYCGKHFDFVFSHTCPVEYQPRDLFLGCVDQSKVDNTMEIWMSKFYKTIDYNVACWGHYHRDRIELPYHEMYYNKFDDLDSIYTRWEKYKETKELPWWIEKGPLYYQN